MTGVSGDEDDQYREQSFTLANNLIEIQTTRTKSDNLNIAGVQIAIMLHPEMPGGPSELRGYSITFSEGPDGHYGMPPGQTDCTINLFHTQKDVKSITAYK